MKKIDHDALARAMTMAQKDRKLAAQLDKQLQDRPWHEVAEFAAYCLQCENLKLLPHQTPPCAVIGDSRARDAADLLRRMIAAGLSEFEPDPLAALGAEVR
jgi:hypothetical protein